MALRLLLVRHGQTAWNLVGRIQGYTDEPLNDVGLAQARRLGRRLAREDLHAAYASTLERTWRTAEVAVAGKMAHDHPIEVTRDPVWREVGYGSWEGLTWSEINTRDPDHAARRLADPANVAPPGGEHFLDLQRRVVPGLEALREKHDGQSVLLVTHGGPIRVIGAWCMGLEPDQAWRFRADNCGLSIVHWGEQGTVLEQWNETAHVREM